MNNKKSHEVQVMSELVDSIANYCGIKQVRKHFLLCVTRYLPNYSPCFVQILHFDILSLLFTYFSCTKLELKKSCWDQTEGQFCLQMYRYKGTAFQ